MKPNKFINFFFGDKEKMDSERYFIMITCLTATLFLIILSIVHLINGFRIQPFIMSSSSSVIMMALYFVLRYTDFLFWPKLILTTIGIAFLDITWYVKYLSNGPVLFFIFAFGALVLWVWHGRALVVLLSIYFLNIVFLFFIDYTASSSLFDYPSPDKRMWDIYLSFFLYSALLIFLLYIIKRDFIAQKEKAIRSDQLKTAFLSNMSHEIRTPMNAIVGFSSLIEDEKDQSTRAQYVEIIQNSSDNLLKLINDIIELSKIETSDFQLIYQSFTIEQLFLELKPIVLNEQRKHNRTGIQIIYDNKIGNKTIISDPRRIQQLLINLIVNALKFTEKGTVTIETSLNKAGMLQFSVIDTGIGIKPEDLPKIFDRFVKFDHNGSNKEGSGIGLTLVQHIVELLKGEITVVSEENNGSTFRISIPVSSDSH
jgi:signal transduction histidine kinase